MPTAPDVFRRYFEARDTLGRKHRKTERLFDEIYTENLNLIRREISKAPVPDYCKQDDDLEAVAIDGLRKAIDNYDPDSGNKFSSYAVPKIKGEIQHYLRGQLHRVGAKVRRGGIDLFNFVQRTTRAIGGDADLVAVCVHRIPKDAKLHFDKQSYEELAAIYKGGANVTPSLLIQQHRGTFKYCLDWRDWQDLKNAMAGHPPLEIKENLIGDDGQPEDNWFGEVYRLLPMAASDLIKEVYLRRKDGVSIDDQVRLVAKRTKRSEREIRHWLGIGLKCIQEQYDRAHRVG